MAEQITIAGSPCRAKLRNPWAVLALTLLTAGFYSLFWWYFINREMRDLGRVHAQPGFGKRPIMSVLAISGLSFFTLYVALVWSVVATTRRVQRSQRLAGLERGLNGWFAAALWIFTLTLGAVVYTQAELNKAWRAQAGAPLPPLTLEDGEEWPVEHPALWDTTTRRAYEKRYGKMPGQT